MVESNLMMAVLMARGGGNFVKPILMALEHPKLTLTTTSLADFVSNNCITFSVSISTGLTFCQKTPFDSKTDDGCCNWASFQNSFTVLKSFVLGDSERVGDDVLQKGGGGSCKELGGGGIP
uniref:Uncharacterized protein n=1 Tax=Romanomermis culicivorax TaxID=13658 RepID=A0A915I9K5_ROMCU